jgi:geranylgeranyl diphosphate synthase type II
MHSINALQKIVNTALTNQIFGTQPDNLYLPINYVLEIGGKRIRAVLCLAACEMFSGNYITATNPALALEIFHNFTLLHDDIMDCAPVRRGKPTAHEKWNQNIALLSGDAMSIIAYKYIAKTPLRMEQCLEAFSNMALNICEGQQLDMDFEQTDNVTIEEYLHMISLKTAVFIACSLKVGAIVGGAEENDIDLMYNIGYNIGMAFQLQDDLLDVFGKQEEFGKQIGGDIVANKRTFLFIHALNNANETQLAELKYWMQKTDFDANEKIKAVTKIYTDLNIKELTSQHIDSYLLLAKESLNQVSTSKINKKEIESFITNIGHRSH